MPPPAARPVAPRKRNRKRKRRAASSSESSSSSSESEPETEVQEKTARPVPAQPVIQSEESSSESSSDSSSESGSELETTTAPVAPPANHVKSLPSKSRTRASPSPSPPPSTLPTFINPGQDEDKDAQEKVMKERFRKFWMASVADGFKDDLEQIRKEPNLGTARLSLLIDSLASGADVFASSSDGKGNINEVEVILE
ncbi:hypothetical protein Hypma_012625 [Hypsizygus marmoreus]|uniref:Ribosome assembly protein 3 n=1 Tax=Hypsizygus marmoreus TaxID=39966 RepID=A0A369JKJ4_HYPMA|nr:hypothetical protein Hypma_012625 [Hypsizygus marmoreus]